MTATATMLLPTNSGESIYLGFANSNEFLTSTNSDNGPVVQVFASGAVNFYGGAGLKQISRALATPLRTTATPYRCISLTTRFTEWPMWEPSAAA